MPSHPISIAVVSLLLAGAAPAAAGCQIVKYMELPIQMAGRQPLATTSIGGAEARFIVDSGAFYSTMSHASAIQYGLRLDAVPPSFRISGLNGDASASVATVRQFGIAGATIPNVQFLVGGTDTGTVGLLGQNLLGLADVEYDLPHGAVRLLRAKGCAAGDLAYWAGARPFALVPLETRRPPFQVHTIGTVTLNGVRLRAVFDTGAQTSILTLAAARRLGVRPDGPGTTPVGLSTGVGSRAVRTWVATFDRLDIGGETIPRPRIPFADIDLRDGDMLIGIDFFLTHRIYVANGMARMLVTYEGGPMFGLHPTRAVDGQGKPIDLSDAAPEPTDAHGFARRGAVLASTGRMDAALADFDRAVALAPNDGVILRQRASARLANRRPLLAAADLDKAITLDPSDADARLMRARLRIESRDPAGARDDLHAADRALPPTSDRRLALGTMLNAVDDQEAALPAFDAWLRSHPEDANRPQALNGRCWTRALLDRELDRALDDCNAAVRQRPGNAAYLDSRALVRLRRGELPQALSDYDAALRIAPRNAWSLYARGIARQRSGDPAGAEADRAAAVALEPGVAERAKRLGLDE